MPATQSGTGRRRRPLFLRVFGAALVLRLEFRPPAPLDAGLILLAWLRRPAIEMPLEAARLMESQTEDTSDRLRRRLDEVFPF